jgi:integrase
LLTWARTTETRFATWDEFEDLDGDMPLWRLSAERMKMNREHVVPLSRQVTELLLRRRRASSGHYVFGGDKPGHPISENTMIFACYRMGYRGRQTVHGFRGLGSTWANEAECFKPDWIEMALAHADENEVRGAYNSALYLTPRRRMLQRWADDIFGQPVEPRIKARTASRSAKTQSACRTKTSGVVPSERVPFWRDRGRRPSLPKSHLQT